MIGAIFGFKRTRGGMGWEVGGRFKTEETYIYLWLINVWQKPAQYCKAIILQLKIIFLKKDWGTISFLSLIRCEVLLYFSQAHFAQ